MITISQFLKLLMRSNLFTENLKYRIRKRRMNKPAATLNANSTHQCWHTRSSVSHLTRHPGALSGGEGTRYRV
jgi:hypothetical protein